MDWIKCSERVPEPDYSARKHGRPTMSTPDRIRKNVTTCAKSGCWEWNGSTRGGYGRAIIGSRIDGSRKSVSTHRLAYETFIGEIPDGMEVCHRCDNRRCVNPDHLFLGTRQDNINDREKKGRNIVFIGEEQPRAKLTRKMVQDARWEHAYRGTSFERLAKKYGVNKKTMQNAISGKTWKCVAYMPEPPKDAQEGDLCADASCPYNQGKESCVAADGCAGFVSEDGGGNECMN